jgi:hypothetical protein
MTKSARSKQPKQPALKHRVRNGRDSYYANIKGKQYVFGYVSREEAERLFAAKLNEILNAPSASVDRPQTTLTVQEVLARFLRSLDLDTKSGELKESTRDFYLYAIEGLPKKPQPENGKPRKQRKQTPFVPFLTFLENAGHSELPVDYFGESIVKEWIATSQAGRTIIKSD